MLRRLVTSLLIVLCVAAALGAVAWYATAGHRADREYGREAERFYSAVAQVARDLRADGAGKDSSLYRAQMMAIDRANTLALRDRQRRSELDIQEALKLYSASAGNWAVAMEPGMDERQREFLDEAMTDGARGDELLARARQELDAGK